MAAKARQSKQWNVPKIGGRLRSMPHRCREPGVKHCAAHADEDCQYPPCEYDAAGDKARCQCVRYWLLPIPTRCHVCGDCVCLNFACSRVVTVEGRRIRRCAPCEKRLQS